MRLATSLVGLLLVPCLARSQVSYHAAAAPLHGFVPDSATAVRVAIAVWIPLYGEQEVMARQPFVASLEDSVWIVTGSPSRQVSPTIAINGFFQGRAVVPLAKIARSDARVLEVSQEW